MSKIIEMPELKAALAHESYEWLAENRSDLAAAVEAAVQRGATDRDIWLEVLYLGGSNRIELANRCKLAAIFLIGQREMK